MAPVVNSIKEIANRAVYWVSEGIKRKRKGHKMRLTDDSKKFMLGWKDLSTGKVMVLPFTKFIDQRDEIEQVFGLGIYKKLKLIKGRKEVFGCQ
jgi:hypothetical protein